jgi:coproporphyrinogen III oxidase
MREKSSRLFRELQQKIANGLQTVEPRSRFRTDPWERTDLTGSHGGGGISLVMSDGETFEQAGVNFSAVNGKLPAEMSQRLMGTREICDFYATGVSLVIHPRSPMVPTVHANYRYIEVADKAWFGGGADLTPYYLENEDAIHFHQILKNQCDLFSPGLYAQMKKDCDEYFFIKHRNETRGIGGVFFDYFGRDEPRFKLDEYYLLAELLGSSFLDSYLPIVKRRVDVPYGDRERNFQLHRRGRYVEFNLVYDRGTLFGLQTNGRIESILMSLPPLASWAYEYPLEADSKEAALIELLKNPREWV